MGLFKKTPKEKFEKANLSSSGSKMLKLAEEGMQKAMTNVAFRYESGMGLKKDPEKALYWVNLAANEDKYGISEDTAEAYFIKANILLSVDNEEQNKLSFESFKKAYEIAFKASDNSVIGMEAGISLSRFYTEKEENEKAKEILIFLKDKNSIDALFELALFNYYEENDLIGSLNLFDVLLKNDTINREDILFEFGNIRMDHMAKMRKLSLDEVSLKNIDETKVLLDFCEKTEAETLVIDEIENFLKKVM